MSTRLGAFKGEAGVPKSVGAPITLPNGTLPSHPRMKKQMPSPISERRGLNSGTTSASSRKKGGGSRPVHPPWGAAPKLPPTGKTSSSAHGGARTRPGSGRQELSGSARSRPGSGRSQQGSARHARSAGSLAQDEEEEPEEQDVRFINIDSKNTSSAGKHDGSLKVFERKTREISVKTVLVSAQERDPEQVFEVSLHGAQVGRITCLEKFTKIRILDLSCNFIQKIEHLDQNTGIRELKLYDNEIANIENLDHLTDLCHLQLQHNKIKTIGKGLNSLKRLKLLRLDSNLLLKIDVRELASVSQLTTLDISNNKLDCVSAVNSLPNLEELFMSGNRLRVVSDLSRCRKLQEVDVSNNRLTDLSGLKQLPNLNILHASKNYLSSVKSLGKLKGLQELKLSGNRISEAKQFAGMYHGLQILDLTDNHLEVWDDVCSLKALPELVELYIAGNPFCSEGGYKPMYHSELYSKISQLEILDGAHMKKKQTTAPGTPLMRPMSASSVISARQVEAQLLSLTDELQSYESSITSKFDSLRYMADEVCPPEVTETFSRASSAASSRPSSRCGKRSRIREAQDYATHLN